MKHLQKTSYIVLLMIYTILSGCNSSTKKSVNSDADSDKESDTEYRISTYEIHISGSGLDGQSFSGTFPNDGQQGQGQLVSKVAKNIPKDVIHLRFNEEKEKGQYIVLNANLVLDDNGKLLPIADFSDDSTPGNGSIITFQIGGNLGNLNSTYQFSSKSGTVSLSNLKLEQDAAKFMASMIDADVEFEAEFTAIHLGTGETPQAVPATIRGEFHIQSIRENLDN